MANQVVYKDGYKVPVKMWNSNVLIDSGVFDQAGRMAMLPFVFKHIALMPDAHVGKGATVGSVIPTKGAIVPAAVGVDIGCFRGDMKVPLLDGTQATFENLEKRSEPFWVYSIDKTGRIVPGLARCVKTRKNAPLMKVVVSGGDEIICTPDHQFMLWDGSYKEAKDLGFNTSLMPLYRRWQTRDGYESVSNGKGKTEQTHLLAWESLNGQVPEGHVVHHKNHIHFDNRPENLELMTISDHSKHHRSVGRRFDNSDPAFQEKRLAGVKRRMEDPEKREKAVKVGTENIKRYMEKNPEHFAEAVKGNGKRGAQYLINFNTSPRECSDCGEILKNPTSLKWHKNKEHGYNHKVIAVEFLEETSEVYCLQVEEHHNFALAAGVFVHNCGMIASRLSLKADDLPDNLEEVYSELCNSIPVGQAEHEDARKVSKILEDRLLTIDKKHPNVMGKSLGKHSPWGKWRKQLGTLGGGNHFIELCLDENDDLWLMLHSGSRNIGNLIGNYFINLAKEDMRRHFINLPDIDLAYLVEGTQHFNDYFEALTWAQDYARLNRAEMMDLALVALSKHLKPFTVTQEAVNCHHNFTALENHHGENVYVTRKGAIRAREGELGIIPGSMGTRSYIVRGKGEKESFCSCSHGAGRVMSRGKAKELISLDDHLKATEGIMCRKDEGVLDESPAAYKDIDSVMASQTDLVEVVHTLKQVLCIKG